jgi:predicted anti-sigma-YlaC factor YlaD
MNCRQAYRFICDNLDEKITSARCRGIRKHIACCPRCQAYLDSVKKTVRLYRTAPGPKLSRMVHRDLMKALNVEMVQPLKPTSKSACRNSR